MIKSVDKTIQVLNCFTSGEPVLGIGEISRMTGFTKSTVSRLLSTLNGRGCVETVEGRGRYRLGYRIYLWGLISQKQNSLNNIARPVMKNLRDKVGEEICLYVVENNGRVCIERIKSLHELARMATVGSPLPLHAGASGRVLLAYLPNEQREQILAVSPLDKLTDQTPATLEKLEQSLAKIRQKGFGISKGEREPNAYSVVAPVRESAGQVVASLSISGPIFRLSDEQLKLNIQSVLEASAEISKKLGYVKSPG